MEFLAIPSRSLEVGSTDLSLLHRVRAGEQEAWVQLVEIYSALIYSRCRSSGLNQEEACDVVQDVFQALFRSIDRFRHQEETPQGFRRWIRTITRNTVIDHFRREAQRVRAVGGSTAQHQLAETADPLSLDLPFLSEIDLPAEEDDALLLLVRRILEAIEPNYEPQTWRAFWLTAVDHRPATEVAQVLGTTPGAVRQAKYKILRRLRNELGDLLDE